MTLDREKVVERLGRVSYYFKSLLAVGWQGDADIYREHRESVNMAIALLKEQQETISSFQGTIRKLNAALEDQPEIVRCKDCKHYMTIHCTCDGCCISDDWFCADGERRDDDD